MTAQMQPFTVGKVVVPDDLNDLPDFKTSGVLTDAVYVGGAGTVAGVTRDGSILSFVGLAAGATLPLAFRRINASGTTATGLVALYVK